MVQQYKLSRKHMKLKCYNKHLQKSFSSQINSALLTPANELAAVQNLITDDSYTVGNLSKKYLCFVFYYCNRKLCTLYSVQ